AQLGVALSRRAAAGERKRRCARRNGRERKNQDQHEQATAARPRGMALVRLWRAPSRLQAPILPEDRALELLQLPARLDPELVHERLARLAVEVECFGLTAGAVQRQHQLSA